MKIKSLFTSSLLLLALLFTGCGKDGQQQDIVKGVDVLTSLEDGDVYLSLAVLVKIGTANLTSITLPIYNYTDPNSPKYGEISFKPTMEPGVNEIKVKFNMTFAAQVSGGYAKLPNGAELPIGGLDESDVVQLEVEKIHSRIYLALQQKRALFGFAVAIQEFDRLNGKIPGANIFLGFDIKGVLGTVGLFTGDEAWESGLAFFLDISKYFNSDIIDDLINGRQITAERLEMVNQGFRAASVEEDVRAAFGNKNITTQSVVNLHRYLKRMKKKTLHFVDK